ncbi:VIT1/CCC1 transporter family protein [Candidatus Kaiserbacteria bacterium]|nr:VIT1/CCC1 transporter family protein [Candidatus Kaiserbacteria bacterium]
MLRNIKPVLAYYIGDIVYGANDGIITTFAVIAGAAGAGFSATVIIVLGIANLIADGFSMGASKYLSLRSEQSLEAARGELRSPLGDGLVTTVSFIVIGTLPLVPFLVVSTGEHTFLVSSVATAVTLFFVGSARSLVIKKNAFVAGLEMLVVGGVASVLAYALGAYVQAFISSL